jgi:hypothetical protein
MKGAIVSESNSKIGENQIYSFFLNFFVEPFKTGLFGFAGFFTVLIFTKGISYLLGLAKEYIVSSEDVLFSLLGLVIVFLIKLSENIKEKASS